MAWALNLGSSETVQSVSSTGGDWGPVVDLASARLAVHAKLSLAPNGGAVATWQSRVTVGWNIEAAIRTSGGWGPPEIVSPFDAFNYGPHMAVDLEGNAIVVWETRRLGCGANDCFGVMVSERTMGGWSQPVEISAVNSIWAVFPDVAAAPNGEVTAVWQNLKGSFEPWVIQSATLSAKGWSAALDISSYPIDAEAPRVVAGPDGTATVVWLAEVPWPCFGLRAGCYVQSTRRTGDGWEPVTDLTPPDAAANFPISAIVADGTVTAVWSRSLEGASMIESAARPP